MTTLVWPTRYAMLSNAMLFYAMACYVVLGVDERTYPFEQCWRGPSPDQNHALCCIGAPSHCNAWWLPTSIAEQSRAEQSRAWYAMLCRRLPLSAVAAAHRDSSHALCRIAASRVTTVGYRPLIALLTLTPSLARQHS